MKMDTHKQMRAAEIGRSIREVMLERWDPVGVREHAPNDEYDEFLSGLHLRLATPISKRLSTARIPKQRSDYIS